MITSIPEAFSALSQVLRNTQALRFFPLKPL
jgi:hypothetical protein